MLSLGAYFGGCVVMDKIDFPVEPVHPPAILDAMPPVGTIFWINNMNTPPSWSMQVSVAQPDITRALFGEWRLVTELDNKFPPYTPVMVPPNGMELRDVTFSVPSTGLLDGKCARLDFAISGSFIDPTFATKHPEWFALSPMTNDVAKVSWTVWEGDPANYDSMRLAGSCQVSEALLGSSGMGTGGTTAP